MNPIVAKAELAAANPSFRLTSFLEFVGSVGKSFVDTPEERSQIKAGLMTVYDTFVAPRAPLIARAARPFVEQFIETTLANIGS